MMFIRLSDPGNLAREIYIHAEAVTAISPGVGQVGAHVFAAGAGKISVAETPEMVMKLISEAAHVR